MYIPTVFQQTDQETLHRFIEEHSFALLCSTEADGTPFASHLPFLLDPQGILIGHMARANPQWQHADGRRVLAIFSGPHAYISPTWYEAEAVVPTWNYAAVHVTGVFRAIHEPDALLRIVRDMIAVFEQGMPRPWQLGEANEYVERQLRAIVGFRIEIDRIEGKWKLNQNHPPERRERVMRALRQRGGEDALGIANLMEQTDG